MGVRRVEIEYPEDLLVGIDEKRLGELAREALFVKLYEQALISSGRAAQLLGMSRAGFLDLLGSYGVSIFDENADLAGDVRRARP